MSSYPITATSSGTRRPWARSASIAPSANRSLFAKTASSAGVALEQRVDRNCRGCFSLLPVRVDGELWVGDEACGRMRRLVAAPAVFDLDRPRRPAEEGDPPAAGREEMLGRDPPTLEALAAHRGVLVVRGRRTPDDDRQALAAQALEELGCAPGGKQNEAVGAAALEVAVCPARVVHLSLENEEFVAESAELGRDPAHDLEHEHVERLDALAPVETDEANDVALAAAEPLRRHVQLEVVLLARSP